MRPKIDERNSEAMGKLIRAVAVGTVVIAAVLAVPSPAQANTLVRRGSISTSEWFGGQNVQYTADVTYLSTAPGTATAWCNATVVGAAVESPTTWCWLDDVYSYDYWDTWYLPFVQTSNAAGTFVIDRTRTLKLCMYASLPWSQGPLRCTYVQ